MRINQLFNQARLEKRKLFIPYITCGDPTLQFTEQLVKDLAVLGADIIELGVPFSDPVADGKTNQLAAMRALKNKVSIRDCCNVVKNLRSQYCKIPIVLFTYFNPIMRLGINEFAQLAHDSQVDGVLVVDLPVEEIDELAKALAIYQINIILLISPTTNAERIAKSNQLMPGFLYYVSRTGVTGAQTDLSATLEKEVENVKQHTSLPIAVGFGISTPEQAASVATIADGVIVGSALVKILETDDVVAGKIKLLDLAGKLIKAVSAVSTRKIEVK